MPTGTADACEENPAEEGVADLPLGHGRVLLISSAFPPTGGPGVQRSAKFAKYLPQWGWSPTVWAADWMPDLPHDDSLCADLPRSLDVRRMKSSGRLLERQWGQNFFRRLFPTLGDQRWSQGLNWRMTRIYQAIRGCMIPDHLVCWAVRSHLILRRVIVREHIGAIYSTFSPASNHLLALMLHRTTGRPWVADFRDLWTDDYCYPRHGRIRRRIERRIEQAILESADAVIGVTEGQTRVLAGHVPEQAAKFHTITNGVDTGDFDAFDRAAVRDELHGPSGCFVLTFAGWFLSDRVSDGLIRGLADFNRWLGAQNGGFEFRVVGTISQEMKQRVGGAGVDIRAVGYQPHGEAIRYMVASDALLLPLPAGRNAATLVPGKLFEYLASQRPILLVGPRGSCESSNLVRQCNAGICAESRADAVCDALKDMWQRWRSGELISGCTPERLAPFTRRHLAGRLAGVLDEVCLAPSRSRQFEDGC